MGMGSIKNVLFLVFMKKRPNSLVVKHALDVGKSAVRFCVGPFRRTETHAEQSSAVPSCSRTTGSALGHFYMMMTRSNPRKAKAVWRLRKHLRSQAADCLEECSRRDQHIGEGGEGQVLEQNGRGMEVYRCNYCGRTYNPYVSSMRR